MLTKVAVKKILLLKDVPCFEVNNHKKAHILSQIVRTFRLFKSSVSLILLIKIQLYFTKSSKTQQKYPNVFQNLI